MELKNNIKPSPMQGYTKVDLLLRYASLRLVQPVAPYSGTEVSALNEEELERVKREIEKELLSDSDSASQNSNSVADAMEVICAKLKNDSGYFISWKANIAMAFVDAMPFKHPHHHVQSLTITKEDIHKKANEAAEAFLNLLIKE